MGWKIIFAPQALEELEQVVRFIAQEDPQAAIRFGDYLVDRADSLTNFPELGTPYRRRANVLDRRKEPELADEGIDLWILYAWTRNLDMLAVWYDEKSESVLPPPLGQLTDDDWDNIAEDVKRHFSEDGDDEYLEIALLDEQLQWPTFQEFRSAKAHLLKWAEWTRANTKARECGNA